MSHEGAGVGSGPSNAVTEARSCKLASHAALPVVLNPDFVHLLRVNYFLDPPVTLPYAAEAELLLSPLCTEVDQGLYVIDPDLRDVLLEHLVSEHGTGRLRDVAHLMWEYGQRTAPWPDRPGLSEAQQLTALNFLDPASARRTGWRRRRKASVQERQRTSAGSSRSAKTLRTAHQLSSAPKRKLHRRWARCLPGSR